MSIYTDLIDKYIQGKATAEELEKINRLSHETPEFKEELLLRLELRSAIRREEKERLKKQLQDLEQKTKGETSFSLFWKIAAAFIFTFGLLWFFNTLPNYEKLYAENFEPYPNIISPSVRDMHSIESIEEKAFIYYDNRNYEKAIPAFASLYDDGHTPYAYFYYGMSLMAEDQIQKAIAVLENPKGKVPDNLKEQTDWYLALGYLKAKDKDKAIPYLEKVIKADHAMATSAKSLLLKIK